MRNDFVKIQVGVHPPPYLTQGEGGGVNGLPFPHP